jgi:uncharacterized protein YecT (DUF1311 family)
MAKYFDKTRKHPIDKSTGDCRRRAVLPEEYAKCISDSHDAWEELLKITFLELLNNIDDNSRKVMKESHHAWSEFRLHEFEFIDLTFSESFTQNSFLEAAERKMEITRNRTIQLICYRDLICKKTMMNLKTKQT